MIKARKIFCFIIIPFLFLAKADAKIVDSLYATIGNKAVTRSDIINEMKIIVILNGQSYSEEQQKQIEIAAIKSLIKRNIKKIEIEKYKNLAFNPSELAMETNNLSKKLNMDLDTLKNIFKANGVNFSDIVDQIKTELLWNSLIFSLYKDRLSINQDEIDEQLKSIQNKKEITEYLISEIIIKSVPQNEAASVIEEIKNKIKVEGFKNVAMNSSISETAVEGGDLGWINENIIVKRFRSAIINTPIGNISEPIFLPSGILLFKVRDKRKAKNVANLEDAKIQLVNAEKTKILNMYSLSHYDNLRRSISIRYFE